MCMVLCASNTRIAPLATVLGATGDRRVHAVESDLTCGPMSSMSLFSKNRSLLSPPSPPPANRTAWLPTIEPDTLMKQGRSDDAMDA